MEGLRNEGLVRKEGFEPPRPFGHKILSLARLPVPPLPQGGHQSIIYTVVLRSDQVTRQRAGSDGYMGGSVFEAAAVALTRIKFVWSVKK